MAVKYSELSLGQIEAIVNKLGGMEGVQRFLAGKAEMVLKSILSFLRTETIPAQSAVTTSKQYFEEAGVKWTEAGVNWLNDNFKSQFLGLEVEAVDETTLSIHKLDEASLDEPILQELGDKTETTPSQFKEFLSKNKKSGEWFIFYLKGKNGELWAVGARWRVDGDGWYVGAYFVHSPFGWDAGGQVVSRN